MTNRRDIVAAWVAKEILPHESSIRRWLTYRWDNAIDVEDVLQEAYCRIAGLTSVEHIGSGKAYFRKIAHNVANDIVRHAKVANLRSVTEIAWQDVFDDEPLADRAVEARQELERAHAILSKLSWTARRVIELRRFEGLSQRETAQQLGVSESVVENHIVRGIRSVLKVMADQDARADGNEVDVFGKR